MERAAEAAREGNLQYLSSLTAEELGRLVGKQDEDGRTLLHGASTSGNTQLVQFLLDHGAGGAVNATDEDVSVLLLESDWESAS